MNIEIANRLVDLRKKSGLSQEELAGKLGLSRQAVSKWERAEASPDTDNLICLAKLYGVSLDELLNTEESIDDIVKEQVEDKNAEPPKENATSSSSGSTAGASEEKKESSSASGSSNNGFTGQNEGHDYFHMGANGIHFGDNEDQGSIDSDGIHIKSSDGSFVSIDKNGIHIKDEDGERYDKDGSFKGHFVDNDYRRAHRFQIAQAYVGGLSALFALITYLLLGFLWPNHYEGWGVSWLVFFLIPLLTSFVSALEKRKFSEFAFPILVTGVYVLLGMLFGYWHPYWVMFLAIPVYYIVVGPIDKLNATNRWKKGLSHIHVDGGGKDDAIDIDAK